jgi:hypothetical protein
MYLYLYLHLYIYVFKYTCTFSYLHLFIVVTIIFIGEDINVNSSVQEVKYRVTTQIQKNQKKNLDISNKDKEDIEIIENKILKNGADILVVSSECLSDLLERKTSIVSFEYTSFVVVDEIQDIMKNVSWEKNPLNFIFKIENLEYLNQVFFIYDNISEDINELMTIHHLFRKWLLKVIKNLKKNSILINQNFDDKKNDRKLDNLISMKNYNEIEMKKNIGFLDILIPGTDFICLSASFEKNIISNKNDIFCHIKNQKISFCLYFNPFLTRKNYCDKNLTFVDILSTFNDENFPLKIYFCDKGMIELRLNDLI